MTARQLPSPDSDSEDFHTVARQHAATGDQGNTDSEVGTLNAKMLSINFSTPLAGNARSERIKQMTNNHPAFDKARTAQEILVKIQTSLRRMPGVAANQSNEIISQLQEVGQIISQETSQLVDALMNVTLDQEDTDKAIARMSIEANLAKAQNDDQAQTINNLHEELDKEKEKRELAEGEVHKVMKDLQKLTQEFKSWKDKEAVSDGSPYTDRDDMIKHLEETIDHLEGQVNNRRSLWAVKHPDPRHIARAIKTLTDSCDDKEVIQQTIMSLRSEANQDDGLHQAKRLSPNFSELPGHPNGPSAAFAPHGPPARFAPLQSGPPRAASTAPQDRRMHQSWALSSAGQSRFASLGSSAFATPGTGRAPSRRGYQQNGQYRPTAPEFHPSGPMSPERGLQRADTFGQRRDYFPTTPTTARGKYGRYPGSTSPDYGNVHSNALTSRFPTVGPLIHMTEMTVLAWRDQVMKLYAVIRLFVDNSANEPSFTPPGELNKLRIWPVLLATYNPLSEHEAISYLDFHLKDESAKSCLVTRVIIDYIVNRVWIPRAWTGADEDATYGLLSVEKDLERTQGQPSSFRQPILDRQAAFIDAILKLDHYPQFCKLKAESTAEMLLSTLQPMLNDGADQAQAYHDLVAVAEYAWSMSSKILSSRLTFDFRFPEVGSRFSCQSMLPIWPNMDPMELQAKHWRVALVTTPVITCRNDTGANISAHSVTWADVVCMQ